MNEHTVSMGAIPSSPETPTITEQTLKNQAGKVFLITGATSGIGFELAKILFAVDATIWITARSSEKAEQTISALKQAWPHSKGAMHTVSIDFSDLKTIKPAVDEFLARETSLDVLFNNAGIMIPPKGTITAQGYEAQFGTNTIGPFLFTKLLTDILVKTASSRAHGNTRVVWVSSSAAANFSPKGGIELHRIDRLLNSGYSQWQLYGTSKAGNILHNAEMARRHGGAGLKSVAIDPGNLQTNLYQNMPRWQHIVAKKLALKPAIYGAYTELYAAFSPDVQNGSWIEPWGKVAEPRNDIGQACKLESEGGTGAAKQFWEWCEKEVEMYSKEEGAFSAKASQDHLLMAS